jgi:flagellar motor switch protein FliN/FliY
MAEAALSAAETAVSNLKQTAGVDPVPQAFAPQPLDKSPTPDGSKGIDLLSDVNLNVKIELGRTRMLVEDVLKLNEGAVVELDKLAGDPVDVYVNERHIARGEVLVLNDNFCVRINEIISQIGDAEQPGKAAG